MARKAEPEKRIGILTGWRCWTVRREDCLLRPIYQRGMIWKPRQPYEALCAAPDKSTGERSEVHPVPWASCRCGIWSVCHPMLLQEVSWKWKDNEILIVGQVALWGRVIEFERGWRAQFGYPTHLYALSDDDLLAQALRERYQVPVASGAAAWALERILPPNLQAPGRADREPDATAEMPAVPFALAGIVEMVKSTEAGGLERMQEDLRRAQAELVSERDALKIERQRLAIEKHRGLVELQRIELELRHRVEQRLKGPAWPGAPVAKARRAAGRAPAQVSETAQRAALIKLRLFEAGITQDHVARAAGVSRPAVSHALSGRRLATHIMTVAVQLLDKAAAAAVRKASE